MFVNKRLLHWLFAVVSYSFINLSLPELVTSASRAPSQEAARATLVNISEAPNLIILNHPRINLFNKIPSRDDLINFGTHLLDDHYGTKMKRIEEDHNYSMYRVTREICRQWLGGSGKHPVTWKTLISVLEQTRLLTLAGNIESSIDKGALNKTVTSFADSDIVLRTAMFLREVYSIQHIIEYSLLDVSNAFLDIMVKDDNSNPPVKHWQSSIDQVTLPKRLLITGRPGAGKTTLLRYLAKEWAEGKALQLCEILFLIH